MTFSFLCCSVLEFWSKGTLCREEILFHSPAGFTAVIFVVAFIESMRNIISSLLHMYSTLLFHCSVQSEHCLKLKLSVIHFHRQLHSRKVTKLHWSTIWSYFLGDSLFQLDVERSWILQQSTSWTWVWFDFFLSGAVDRRIPSEKYLPIYISQDMYVVVVGTQDWANWYHHC